MGYVSINIIIVLLYLNKTHSDYGKDTLPVINRTYWSHLWNLSRKCVWVSLSENVLVLWIRIRKDLLLIDFCGQTSDLHTDLPQSYWYWVSETCAGPCSIKTNGHWNQLSCFPLNSQGTWASPIIPADSRWSALCFQQLCVSVPVAVAFTGIARSATHWG